MALRGAVVLPPVTPLCRSVLEDRRGEIVVPITEPRVVTLSVDSVDTLTPPGVWERLRNVDIDEVGLGSLLDLLVGLKFFVELLMIRSGPVVTFNRGILEV